MFPTDGTFDPSPVHRPIATSGQGGDRKGADPKLPGWRTLWVAVDLLFGVATLLAMAALVVFAAMHLPMALLMAWPLYAVAGAPFVLVVAANLAQGHHPIPNPTQAKTAAQWVVVRLAHLGLGHVRVLPGAVHNFFHPNAQVIGLSDNVHSERTAQAHATAAHELGHAWIHRAAPRRARAASWCRRHAARASHLGFGLLFGAAMTGAHVLLPVAMGLLGATLLARVWVVLEEAAASAIALRELRATGMAAAELGEARRSLRWALATYVGQAIGHAVPLVLAPTLMTFFGEGLLTPGASLGPRSAQIGDLLSLFILGSAALVAISAPISALARRTEKVSSPESFVLGVSGLACVALTLCAWNQPPALDAPIRAALAGSVVWGAAYKPVAVALRLLGVALTKLQRETIALNYVDKKLAELAELVELMRAPEPTPAKKLAEHLWVLLPVVPLAALLALH
jgi:hypothetical protein